MKKQSLNVDRVSVSIQTANHIKVTMFNVEFDYSFEKLFAVSIRNHDGTVDIICRDMQQEEKQHSGQHFNTLEPNKKLRLPYRDWKKKVNGLLQFFRLEIPEVKL